MSEQGLYRFIDIQHYLIGLTILKSKVFYLPNILKYTVINTTTMVKYGSFSFSGNDEILCSEEYL